MRFSVRLACHAVRLAPAMILVAAACGLGGCANIPASGGASAAYASANLPAGTTVAFESVDGPPPQVFDRMVNLLDSEARLRNIAVVSRKDSAAYRVRSYLSAQVRGSQTAIAWVWDVYDGNQQRALRLSGEEPAGKGNRDAWASADDLVLRRIAQAGLTGLSGLMNGTAPAEPAAPPAIRGNGAAMASAQELQQELPSDAQPSQVTAFAETGASFSAR